MKKVTSLVGNKQGIDAVAGDLASELKNLGFSKSAVIIAAASSALAEHESDAEIDIEEDIEDGLDEASDSVEDDDNEYEDDDNDEELDDSLEDSDAEDDESSEVVVSSSRKYTSAELKKLRNIATACVEDGIHTKAARQLLKSIDAYEAAR